MPKRYTYQEICKLVDNISNGKTKLISEEYVNAHTPLLFRCQCGNEFFRSYDKFKRGQVRCQQCSIKSIKSALKFDISYITTEIEKTGCKYISGDYENSRSRLNLQCRCGNIFVKSWSKFMSGQDRCPECGNRNVSESKRKYDTENAKEILSNYGYTMIGNFINAATKVECICEKGHNCFITLSHLISERHTGCLFCAQEMRKGEKHPNYKGGVSMLDDDIRKALWYWKDNIREIYNNQCPITHTTNSDTVVHHLTSLSTIYNEAVYDCGYDYIKLHDSILNNHLSEMEKDKLITEIVEKHTQRTGILINKEIHIAFHKQYGYGNNTPEQFDEFLRDNYHITLSQIQK